MGIKISNQDARRLWLNVQGLAEPPTGDSSCETLVEIIEKLGFVQLDTIQVVARAHHHILWSRNQSYREPMYDRLLTDECLVFEHFTHDASILPMKFYPLWRRQFSRMEARVKSGTWGAVLPPLKERRAIRKRIEREGPLACRDFKSAKARTKGGWERPPHKFALDYMWYAGDLATSHRKNFNKYYDLAERIIPPSVRRDFRDDEEQVCWLCHGALARLGFGSYSDIQKFWAAVDLDEVRNWAANFAENLVNVEIERADGSFFNAIAPMSIEDDIANLKKPTSRLRILNPFDPVVRDRERLKRLFGFDYKIEIFTPAAKRKYGYYVYPILVGDRFIGRIEIRADRKAKVLTVENLWAEENMNFNIERKRKLESEISRLTKFVGASQTIWRVEL